MLAPRKAVILLLLLSNIMRFQMSLQMTCLWRCIVTLAAFERLFSAVPFQMCLHIAYKGRRIITLVAFVWLFSNVRFQMSPQIAYLRKDNVTLGAFGCLFPIVCLSHWNLFVCLVFTWIVLFKCLIHCQASSPAQFWFLTEDKPRQHIVFWLERQKMKVNLETGPKFEIWVKYKCPFVLSTSRFTAKGQ